MALCFSPLPNSPLFSTSTLVLKFQAYVAFELEVQSFLYKLLEYFGGGVRWGYIVQANSCPKLKAKNRENGWCMDARNLAYML
jgi:hypothetical protein